MRHKYRAMVALGVTFASGALSAGCRRADQPLGPPDAYLVMRPAKDPNGKPTTSASGLPVLAEVALDDPQAAPLHKQLGLGFGSELLRTDYLAKQFLRDAEIEGRRFPPEARASANEPTIFVLGAAAASGLGLAKAGAWGGPVDHPGVAWIALDPDLDRDTVLVQTLAGKLGRRIATAIAAGTYRAPIPAPEATSPLVDGYALAMEVIGREWRFGEGPQGTVPPDAGTREQRERFGAVRQNLYVTGPDGGALRSARELLADPGVAATVLYRMAQSKLVGRRVAAKELYSPFVTGRVPEGVSPAAVLGPFRNFQAKLLSAWGRAVLRGQAPHDIVDLVESYGRALPEEKGEAVRILVVTTFGATVKAGGVPVSRGADALAELTALAAEAAASRRGLKDALASAAQPAGGAQK